MHYLPGRDLDILVAKTIFNITVLRTLPNINDPNPHHGWRVQFKNGSHYWAEDLNNLKIIPNYSTDLTAAMKIISALTEHQINATIDIVDGENYVTLYNDDKMTTAIEWELSHAICLAALQMFV